MRRDEERKELEDEERIRSQVFNVLSEKEFHQHTNIEDQVKQLKNESRSWIKPKDLTKEIERMLNEKVDYSFSIDLAGVKRTTAGQEIRQDDQKSLVKHSPFESEPKTVQRKAPGASKYEE